jgi:hypothetical protein
MERIVGRRNGWGEAGGIYQGIYGHDSILLLGCSEIAFKMQFCSSSKFSHF